MALDRIGLPVVLPGLIDYLVTQWTSLVDAATVLVTDGPAWRFDQPAALMIGVDDVTGQGSVSAGTSQVEWQHTAFARRGESGKLTCAATAWNGVPSMKQARDKAFSIINTVSQDLRKNPCVSMLGIFDLSLDSYSLSQDQSEDGAVALIVFQVGYTSRI